MANGSSDNLENKVEEANSINPHPVSPQAEHKEEKKPASALESVVSEATHGIGSAFKLGLAGLIP